MKYRLHTITIVVWNSSHFILGTVSEWQGEKERVWEICPMHSDQLSFPCVSMVIELYLRLTQWFRGELGIHLSFSYIWCIALKNTPGFKVLHQAKNGIGIYPFAFFESPFARKQWFCKEIEISNFSYQMSHPSSSIRTEYTTVDKDYKYAHLSAQQI